MWVLQVRVILVALCLVLQVRVIFFAVMLTSLGVMIGSVVATTHDPLACGLK